MTRILSIDPGSTESAWLLLVDGRPERWAKEANETVRDRLRWGLTDPANEGYTADPNCEDPIYADLLVIETIAPRGERLYSQVVDMLIWAGRFAEAARPLPVEWLSREAVKRHLCPADGRKGAANDADVRGALVQRFGGSREAAVGTKRQPGPLHGITADVWSALAVAVAWEDGVR